MATMHDDVVRVAVVVQGDVIMVDVMKIGLILLQSAGYLDELFALLAYARI